MAPDGVVQMSSNPGFKNFALALTIQWLERVVIQNHDFRTLEGYGSKPVFQIHIFEKRADPFSGVCHNSFWSLSHETKNPGIWRNLDHPIGGPLTGAF